MHVHMYLYVYVYNKQEMDYLFSFWKQERHLGIIRKSNIPHQS